MCCLKAKAIPRMGYNGLPMMPVDMVVKTSLRLLFSDSAEFGVYNIFNNSTATEQELAELFGEFGVKVEFLEFNEWRDKCFAQSENEDSLLGPLKDIYEDEDGEGGSKFLKLHPIITNLKDVNFSKISKKVEKNIPDALALTVPLRIVLRKTLERILHPEPEEVIDPFDFY